MATFAKIIELSRSDSAEIKRKFLSTILVNGNETNVDVSLTSNQEVITEFIKGYSNVAPKNKNRKLSIAIDFHRTTALATLQLLYDNNCIVYRLWENGVFQERLPEVLISFLKNVELTYRAGEQNDGNLDAIENLKRAYEGLEFSNVKRVEKGDCSNVNSLIHNQKKIVQKGSSNWTEVDLSKQNVLLAVLNVFKTWMLD